MNEEELIILAFLGASPESYFARREIARRAVKRKVYEENPHWADAALAALLDKRLIEQDESALYRMKHEAILDRKQDEDE
jgi:hypothetical protein